VTPEAGLELKRKLSELLSAQHGSDTVMKLQKQVDSQQNTITTITVSLNDKIIQHQTLQADLIAAKDKISSLEADMLKVNENLNLLSAKLMMKEKLLEKNKSLQAQLHEEEDRKSKDICQLQKEKSTLQETVTEFKHNILTKESEISVLHDCLKQPKNVSDEEGNDKLQALLDVGHSEAELKLMTIERDIS
jgi:chromosome segregation ATPase